MENESLGKCCICETENKSVRNLITLNKKIPDESLRGGWGCFVCGLPAHGAVAVLCDECLNLEIESGKGTMEIKFACIGYPEENRRVEIEKLTTDFRHDLSKHPELNNESSDVQDFIECRNCEKIVGIVDCRCANCGEEICIVCGCTDSAACLDGCEWARPNVCSNCE